MRTLANILAIVFVLLTYTFFGSWGKLSFHRIQWDQGFGRPADGYYASLAEGYLRGQLSMAHKPDPRLMALAHPYDFEARRGIDYLWDASYLNGRYYLYFTPLPALIFQVPARLLTGSYASDQLMGTAFAVWAFLMSVAFIRRALKNRALNVPMPVWIITLGLSSIVPFVLPYSRTYENAIFCGAAFTATWAYALLRFIEAPTNRRLLFTSIWLALAIAARPNLGVLVLILATAIVAVVTRRDLTKAAVVAVAPLMIAGAALMIHNCARFGDPFEFGHRYQLTYMPMGERSVCGVRNFAEVMRLCHSSSLYTFNLPLFSGTVPFVEVRGSLLDPDVSFGPNADQVGGILPYAPLSFIGTLFAIILALRRDQLDPGLRAAMLLVASGWIVLLGLSTCWFVSARYEIDFWFLLSAGAIVCLEAGLTFLANAGVPLRPLRVMVIVVALVTSLLGTMLGFRGTTGSFQHENPKLYDRLSRFFG